MAWIGPAIGAGAGLIGDVLSQQGQQQTNAQMQANMLQQENWQTQMANTAMQRRVTDLKAAGLNPLLAVGTPGAAVGSVGLPSIQNPSAAMGSLGGQVSGAIQLATQQAQVKAMNAQADKATADAAVTNASLPYTAETSKQSLANLKATENVLNQQGWSIAKDFDVKSQQAEQLMTDNSFRERYDYFRQKLMEVDLQRQTLGLPRLEADASWQKMHPQLSGWLQSGTTPAVQSGVSSALGLSKLFVP